MMVYVDSNVFVFCFVDSGELGNVSQQIVSLIEKGTCTAFTSVLTYDEVVWGVRKKLSKEESFLAGDLFLSLSHLTLKDVTRQTILVAQHLMKHLALKPRDAIHLATMQLEDETRIISEDADFDKIKEIKRFSMQQFLKQC